MDKSYRTNHKSHRINGHKKEKIGLPTGILASDNTELLTGDTIIYYDQECIILFNKNNDTFEAMPVHSCWYNDKNPFDPNSYGKAYTLPADNGAKQIIHRISNKGENHDQF